MEKLHDHPKDLTLVAYAISAAVVIALALGWGPRAFIDAWGHPQTGWLIVAGAGALLAIPAYMLSYRALMRFDGGLGLSLALAMRLVALGFAPFVPGGGFQVDKHALEAIDDGGPDVGTRVFAIGALELAVLTPVAWGAAIVLLITADPRPMTSSLTPWVVAVPVGFAVLLALAAWGRRHGSDPRRSGLRGIFGHVVAGISMLTQLPRQAPDGPVALLGMAAYWACDIASFYAAAHFIGLPLNVGEAIVSYATGYALTRRSMPLGGAGVTEALLTFSLHWMGQPIPAALAVVVVYRVFNFVLPTVPALLARPQVAELIAAGT